MVVNENPRRKLRRGAERISYGLPEPLFLFCNHVKKFAKTSHDIVFDITA